MLSNFSSFPNLVSHPVFFHPFTTLCASSHFLGKGPLESPGSLTFKTQKFAQLNKINKEPEFLFPSNINRRKLLMKGHEGCLHLSIGLDSRHVAMLNPSWLGLWSWGLALTCGVRAYFQLATPSPA